MDSEQLWNQWMAERGLYGRLCEHIKQEIEKATSQKGIPCQVVGRVKEPNSLVKKALARQYNNPYEDIQDKAGVRIVCTYKEYLDELEEVLRELFDVYGYQDKAAELGYDRMGYSGRHFEVRLRDGMDTDYKDMDGLICEIQLLTRAQSIWADISHELTYKPAQPPPAQMKRAIHLQNALIELFDNQISQIRSVLREMEGFREAAVLATLERSYWRYTGKDYDHELSLHLIGRLLTLFEGVEPEVFDSMFSRFLEEKHGILTAVFGSYAEDDRRSLLLFQPESLLLLWCMERDSFRLKNEWAQFAPLDLLKDLADVWGLDIGTLP